MTFCHFSNRILKDKYRHIRGYSAICQWLDDYGACFFEDMEIWGDNRLHVSFINPMPRLNNDNEYNLIEDDDKQDSDYVNDNNEISDEVSDEVSNEGSYDEIIYCPPDPSSK